MTEEATVDAYHDEQLTGLFTAIEDHLMVPFTTAVPGVEVMVTALLMIPRQSANGLPDVTAALAAPDRSGASLDLGATARGDVITAKVVGRPRPAARFRPGSGPRSRTGSAINLRAGRGRPPRQGPVTRPACSGSDRAARRGHVRR